MNYCTTIQTLRLLLRQWQPSDLKPFAQLNADAEVMQFFPITFILEVGWRLAKEHWGHGYATESAKAVLEFAFNNLNEDVVYTCTALPNLPSQKVMQRICMTNTGIEFNHSNLAKHKHTTFHHYKV